MCPLNKFLALTPPSLLQYGNIRNEAYVYSLLFCSADSHTFSWPAQKSLSWWGVIIPSSVCMLSLMLQTFLHAILFKAADLILNEWSMFFTVCYGHTEL